MDRLALAEANVLVGQPAAAAAIEIGPLPARFQTTGGSIRIALSGASRGISIQGRDISNGETYVMADGEVLAVRATRARVFSYLAFEGGILAEPVFGSLSVHARSAIGSPLPRALQAGDLLDVGDSSIWEAERNLAEQPRREGPIRVVLGPQDDHFSEEALAAFLTTEWVISPTSDRMGYRLEGPALAHARGHNIISDGIALGSIQVPGNGQPLVLLADRGTTGGYPKIATIITADIGRMAQTPAGSKVRFTAISMAEAQDETRKFFNTINDLPRKVRTIGGGDLSPEFLLGANLAGAAIDALE
jgi:biotin-dependent carboxylase-like uncharacterized protein